MTETAIQVRDLRKSFKKTEVLKGVDFEVRRGEIFALLGSNGAGKTTIVKILTTLLFLPFASSAFVPTASMPPAVRAFAENQPVTSIVEALRSLLAGRPAGSDIWAALSWCLGILIVAYACAMRVYRRRAG